MDLSHFASLERSTRLLKIRTLVLSVLLLVSFGANLGWVHAASDPPIRVYTATHDDAGGGGSSNEGEFLILTGHTIARPLRLVSVNTNHLGRHDHTCLVTASAQVHRPPNVSRGIVILGLSEGADHALREGTQRRAHLVETPDEDQRVEEVTTTFAFRVLFRNIGGSNTRIRFSAAYDSGGILTVTKPSMTVVCLRDRI